MVVNYDFANGTAIVQHWSRATGQKVQSAPHLQLTLAAGTKDQAAYRKGDKCAAHIDQNQRPRIRFKRRER